MQNTVEPGEDKQKKPGKGKKKQKYNTLAGKKRKPELEKEESRKRLRVTYEKQVKQTWELLNEIKLHFGWKVENPCDKANHQLVKKTAEQAGRGDEFPTDVFSEALAFVFEPGHDLSMSVSFTIQLLAKISILLKETDESAELTMEKMLKDCKGSLVLDPTTEQREAWDESGTYSQINEDCAWNDYHTRLKFELPSEFYRQKAVKWKINDQYQEEFELENRNTQEKKVFTIPTDLGHYSVDPFRMAPEGNHTYDDINWHTEDVRLYTAEQPLHAGSTFLKRKLVDYHADIRFANDDFCIFIFTHLLEAFRVLFPKAQDAEHDRMFLEQQHPEWFPLHTPRPDNATDFLEMVSSRVEQNVVKTVVGSQSSDYPHLRRHYNWMASNKPEDLEKVRGTETHFYDYHFREESQIKPHLAVKTLWEIFILGQPDASIATFGDQLKQWADEWQYREKHLKSSKAKDRKKALENLKEVLNRNQATDSLSWESLVKILEEDVPKLPCMEKNRNFRSLAEQYRSDLKDVENEIGFKWDNVLDQDERSFYCRMLFNILQDWKEKEGKRDPEDKKQDWKKKTLLAKIRVVFEKRNEREIEREKCQKRKREDMIKFGV